MVGRQIEGGEMGKTVNVHDGKGRQVLKPLLRVVVLTAVLVAALGCGVPIPQPSLSQPESPPPGVLNSPLVDNRWRIVDVTFHGEDVTFDLFKPMYIIFTREGVLHIYSERCGSGRYAIAYLGEQRYRLGQGSSTAEDCGALIMRDDPTVDCTALVGSDASWQTCARAISSQLARVRRALEATNEYVLDKYELRLKGETAEMHLVLDNP
jgi:hypothetical protein